MLVKHYRHRLPADYPMARIRGRIAERGPSWDETPGLGFKAFVVRERGRLGAEENAYASLYLWREAGAALDFLTDARFASVVETFGRPRIDTWLALDARAAPAGPARTLIREAVGIEPGTDLRALRAGEAERNRAALARDGRLAVVSAVDAGAWRLLRLTLSPEPPARSEQAGAYEILHLARPGWAALAPRDPE
ncbi:DUF4865 family protein [Methylobacterium soli]|uniref:DUF4865 family protein n=1 Tax=Methylobacterium soli TaxID=553447 RepID=A0A6L3T083_9HYPH|nr:DUF4865 family protein [Methylobacterium soli]KAB1079877.1 DUF4865 family protein [Methylobacterium soli]GJE46503.1 hypothetical protein AEGHOMDF_5709 [Methylobacterium soli]